MRNMEEDNIYVICENCEWVGQQKDTNNRGDGPVCPFCHSQRLIKDNGKFDFTLSEEKQKKGEKK